MCSKSQVTVGGEAISLSFIDIRAKVMDDGVHRREGNMLQFGVF